MNLAPGDTTHKLREVAPDLRSRLERSRDDMVEFTRELVQAESPSLETAAHAENQASLVRALELAGFTTVQHPDDRTGGYLIAERGSKGPLQLLLGHSDTVWPLGTVDERPFEVRDGRMRGPGVFDMKAGLTQMIFALQAVEDLGLTPSVHPVVLVNSDEEIGSPASRDAIEKLAPSMSRVLVMEPSLGLSGKLKTARKGGMTFTITVRGHAAHAGLDPEGGSSAILHLSHLIPKIFDLNDPERGVSVNVGKIDGGLRPNVVAPYARAVVEVRAPTAGALGRIEERIRVLATRSEHARVEIHAGLGRPPLEPTSGNTRLWHAARGVAGLMGLDLQEGLAGGSSDGNLTSPYAPTLDGLGPVGDGAHAPHEFVLVDRMPERATLLALLVLLPPGRGPSAPPEGA